MRAKLDMGAERLGPEGGGLLTMGYWWAVVCGLGAVGYGVASILVGHLAPSAIEWEGMERFVADYQVLPTVVLVTPPLVVALTFPLLVLAVSTRVAGPRRPLAPWPSPSPGSPRRCWGPPTGSSSPTCPGTSSGAPRRGWRRG